jgi:hypothetical protein
MFSGYKSDVIFSFHGASFERPPCATYLDITVYNLSLMKITEGSTEIKGSDQAFYHECFFLGSLWVLELSSKAVKATKFAFPSLDAFLQCIVQAIHDDEVVLGESVSTGKSSQLDDARK